MEMPLIINDDKMDVATCNRIGREGEATMFWLLRYPTITKPTFKLEYVATCILPAGGPARQTLCDEIATITCNDACIATSDTKQGKHNLLVKPF